MKPCLEQLLADDGTLMVIPERTWWWVCDWDVIQGIDASKPCTAGGFMFRVRRTESGGLVFAGLIVSDERWEEMRREGWLDSKPKGDTISCKFSYKTADGKWHKGPGTITFDGPILGFAPPTPPDDNDYFDGPGPNV